MDLEDDFDILVGDEADKVPQDITNPDPVFDMAFHPKSPFLAIGQISGAVCIHEYKATETRYLTRLQLHSGGISGMEFTENGSHLVTVSSDQTINVLDCATQQSVINIAKGKGNPHKYGISSVNICTENLVATGDDDGKICLFDMRTKKAAMKYHEHADFVSQMLFFSEVNHIVSASGDTCLGVFDMRYGKVIDFSDKRKDELMCIAFVPETCDIIAGTPTGSLPVWRYNGWTRPYDTYDYHPKECETIVTYNDNIVLTGACDGMVRVLQVHPVKRNLIQLGGNRRRQGISKIRISHDRKMLAVSGTDNIVNFIDIEFLGDDSTLDKLRSRAEQRVMATLREATEEQAAIAAAEEAAMKDSDDSEWTNSDDDSDDDSDAEDDANDDVAAAVAKKPAPKKEAKTVRKMVDGNASGDESSDVSDVSSDDSDNEGKTEKTQRQINRERADAAKWLKEQKRKKVNFQFERRRRRVQGFWGDLKD